MQGAERKHLFIIPAFPVVMTRIQPALLFLQKNKSMVLT